MAKVTFTIAIDMRTFAGYDFSQILGSAGQGNSSDTEYNWRYNSGFYEIVTGSGFSAGFGTFFPSAGTVTGWDFGINQFLPDPDPWHPTTGYYSYWNFTGLSVPAAEFSNAVDGTGADVAAYMPTMLAGNDTVIGSEYADYLLGFEGIDTLRGNGGADTLDGGGGSDTLDGGLGKDVMIGGLGNDRYIVDRAGDLVVENADAGLDLVTSLVSFTLGNNVENLVLSGTAAISGTGNSLANNMTGNDAANVLLGGGANDVLKGGLGDDTLNGGKGNDSLRGGAGLDKFVFDSTLNASTNHDTIVNYSVADDTIVLDQSIFRQLTTLGTLGGDAFHIGSGATEADDRIIYNSATGNIYYDADGSGAGAQLLFATVAAATALTNADFFIVS